MCLAIPGKIIKKIDNEQAEVLLGKVKKLIRVSLLPEVKDGDYVLVHAGYAITKVDFQQANEIEQAWEELES
ncbi:MAG: HypC/HybG/HupF family hydrogenase formation chaperone [Candidatus Atribacteria bacterium]|jgi:hydrogenase expression/formation protein HypC|nr:HypC/HybG/HupF family hydrogenase formation chaperone [Candidatus Atribacteria bacterium]